MRVLIVVTSRHSFLSNMTYDYAIKKGFEVFIINGFKHDDYLKSTFDFFNNVDSIVNIAISLKVNAVICLSAERVILRDALLKEELEKKGIKVIGNNFSTAKILHDKRETKDALIKNNIKTIPGFNMINSKLQCSKYADEIGFPLIIKHTLGSGGFGNSIINHKDDFLDFFEKTFNIEDFICEKLIDGIELSVEVFGSTKGYIALPLINKGVTSKMGIHPKNKIRYTHEFDNLTQKCHDIALTIAEKFKILGVIEVEFIWNEESDSIYIMEINPRMGGATLLSMAASNLLLPELYVDLLYDYQVLDTINYDLIQRAVEIPLKEPIKKEDQWKFLKLNTFKYFSGTNSRKEFQGIILSGKVKQIQKDLSLIKDFVYEIPDNTLKF